MQDLDNIHDFNALFLKPQPVRDLPILQAVCAERRERIAPDPVLNTLYDPSSTRTYGAYIPVIPVDYAFFFRKESPSLACFQTIDHVFTRFLMPEVVDQAISLSMDILTNRPYAAIPVVADRDVWDAFYLAQGEVCDRFGIGEVDGTAILMHAMIYYADYNAKIIERQLINRFFIRSPIPDSSSFASLQFP